MKAAVEPLSQAVTAEKSWFAVYSDLAKARLTFLVLLTTLVGFYLGSSGPVDYLLMFHTLFGTALVAGGASALNQLLERDHDCLMRRTQSRPLPSGRLQPQTVLLVGGVASIVGLVYLAPPSARFPARSHRSWVGRLPREANYRLKVGLCLQFLRFGNCLISSPSPGFTVKSMPAPDSKCCRL
jgi:hypothetical protein